MNHRLLWREALVLSLALSFSCSDDGDDLDLLDTSTDGSDTDGVPDTDAEADTDDDTDSNPDTAGETGGDTDADADVDADADADADGDADADADGDADADADGDTEPPVEEEPAQPPDDPAPDPADPSASAENTAGTAAAALRTRLATLYAENVFLLGIASKTARVGGDGGLALDGLDASSGAIAHEVSLMYGGAVGDAYYRAWWAMTRQELAYSAARAAGDYDAADAAEAGAYAKARETVDILIAANPQIDRAWLGKWMDTLVVDTLLLLDIEQETRAASQYDRYYWTIRKTKVLGQVLSVEYDVQLPDPLPGEPDTVGAEFRAHLAWLVTDNTFQTTLLTWAESGVGDSFAANKYLHERSTADLSTAIRHAYGDAAADAWSAAWAEQIAAIREYANRKERGTDTSTPLARLDAAEDDLVDLIVSLNGYADRAQIMEALDARNDALIATADAQHAGSSWTDDARAARAWGVAFTDLLAVAIYEQDPTYAPPRYGP